MKSCIVFQLSLQDSTILFSSRPDSTQQLRLLNRAVHFSYHYSPGTFVQLKQMYDSSKQVQTVFIEVLLVSLTHR